MDRTLAAGWGLAGLFLGILLWPYITKKIKVVEVPTENGAHRKETKLDFVERIAS